MMGMLLLLSSVDCSAGKQGAGAQEKREYVGLAGPAVRTSVTELMAASTLPYVAHVPACDMRETSAKRASLQTRR